MNAKEKELPSKPSPFFAKPPKVLRFKKTALMVVILLGTLVAIIILTSLPKQKEIASEDTLESESENVHWLAANTALNKPQAATPAEAGAASTANDESASLTINPEQREKLATALKEMDKAPSTANDSLGTSNEANPESLQAAQNASIAVNSDRPSQDTGASQNNLSKDNLSSNIIQSSNKVPAGTLISIVFLSTVNSELPGFVLGQVTRDVYSATRKCIIPQGAKLLLQYEATHESTERLAYKGVSLILPEGKTIALDNTPVIDMQGQMGLHDQSNHHRMRNFLATLGNFSVAQAHQVATSQLESAININGNSGLAMDPFYTANGFSQKPTTFYVRAGYACNLLLIKDLVLPAY